MTHMAKTGSYDVITLLNMVWMNSVDKSYTEVIAVRQWIQNGIIMSLDFSKIGTGSTVDTVLPPREIFNALPNKETKFQYVNPN